MKKVIKNNKMIVDLTNITLDDVYKAFAIAKFNTMRKEQRDVVEKVSVDKFFTELQYSINDAIADYGSDNVTFEYGDCGHCNSWDRCVRREDSDRTESKKPNVFKRFWNWVTRKK